MRVKHIISGFMSAALLLSLMTACSGGQKASDHQESPASAVSGQSAASESEKSNVSGQSTASESEKSNASEQSAQEQPEEQKSGKMYTLTIRDSGKSDKMTAQFINTMSGANEAVPMTKTDEGTDYFIYSCQADTSKYNMVHLDYSAEKPTLDVAFNKYVSGWYLSEGLLRPYVAGKEPDYNTKFETKIFQFDGYDKNVYIWTPDDYDPASAEKYSTIYLFDGQSDLADSIMPDDDGESWHIGEHITSMMSLTDNKAIVVGIETVEDTRYNELIPDLGELSIKNYPTTKRGGAFAQFLCDTVVPYIQNNYNVRTDAEHTAVTGSSLGGLEAFYTAMEHPDTFGTAGALSPSFWAYDLNTWTQWLLPKMSGKNLPYIYLYGGDYALDSGALAILMNNGLLQSGYPKDRIVCSVYQPGEHLNVYWQNMLPEFLQAMFERKVSALENGFVVPVSQEMQKMIKNYQQETSVTEREPTDKDYVYYDNSETKWEKVCAYWWGPYGASTTKITSNEYYDHKWPGIEMERIGDTDIYRVVAPSGAVGIIFDNGVGDDELAEGTEAYQTGDITYDKKIHPGQVYKIDMTQKPKAGTGIEKIKYKYPVGTWSDYNS